MAYAWERRPDEYKAPIGVRLEADLGMFRSDDHLY